MDGILDDLLDMFPHMVTVQSVTTDGWGVESLGAARLYPAFVRGRIQNVKDQNGKQVKSSVQAVVAGTGFKVTDVFTLPSDFSPNQPAVINISRATDENGAHHETVYF